MDPFGPALEEGGPDEVGGGAATGFPGDDGEGEQGGYRCGSAGSRKDRARRMSSGGKRKVGEARPSSMLAKRVGELGWARCWERGGSEKEGGWTRKKDR